MTRFKLMLLCCTALALQAGPIPAAEVDSLARRVAKYAAQAVGPTVGKYPCVCQDGGPNHGRAGFAQFAVLGDGGNTQKVATFCTVFTFGPSGASTYNENCLVFVSLAK